MIFVPFVPPPPPSPRAQELGRRLRETVDEFKRDNPGLKGAEIRQAMHLGMQGQTEAGTRVAVGLALGLGLLVLFGFLFMGHQMPLGGQTVILTSLIVLGVLLVGIVFVLKNR
jgi:hypothetical protein